ncbi:MAG: TonB family protein [Rubrivivax sp.]|nr:TonB family protein [Rubrivivax sp.]
MRTPSTIRRPALTLGLLACLLPAWSQTAGPAAAAKAGARPDAAEAAAAMERAQRLANSPLRMILEASRVRRKGGPEAAPEAADAWCCAAPRHAPRGARAGSRWRRTCRPRGGEAPAAVPVPVSRPEATPEPAPQPPLVTLEADAALAQPLPSATAALKADAAPQPMLPLGLTPGPLPSPEMAALLVQPKLLAMAPPDSQRRMLDQAGSIVEVAVELTIRADGSVAEVSVLTPAPRALQRSVVDALMQWRYEPLPAERKHRVELVFGRDG